MRECGGGFERFGDEDLVLDAPRLALEDVYAFAGLFLHHSYDLVALTIILLLLSRLALLQRHVESVVVSLHVDVLHPGVRLLPVVLYALECLQPV